MGINTLLSAINAYGGLAHANRFSLNIPGLPADTIALCQSITLPGRTIQTQEYQNQELMSSFPFLYDDGDLPITFMLTNNQFIYDFFVKWMEKVIDTEKFIAGYKKDFAKPIILQHLDTMDKPISEYKLLDCWPKSITALELSSNNENQISVFTVTFSFKKFEYKNSNNYIDNQP